MSVVSSDGAEILPTADAGLAASIFHYGTYTIQETKQVMADMGVPVRLESLRRA